MSNEKTTSLDELKLPKEVLDLAKRLEKTFKIGDGNIINVEKDVFADTLPDGLTIEQVEQVQKHRDHLVSAASLALGHIATGHFKKHKDVKTVELSMPFAKDKFAATYDRSREYPGRGEGAEKIVKFGVLTADFTANGAVGSRGSLNKVRKYLNGYTDSVLNG